MLVSLTILKRPFSHSLVIILNVGVLNVFNHCYDSYHFSFSFNSFSDSIDIRQQVCSLNFPLCIVHAVAVKFYYIFDILQFSTFSYLNVTSSNPLAEIVIRYLSINSSKPTNAFNLKRLFSNRNRSIYW